MAHFPRIWPNGFKDGITTLQHQLAERIDTHLTKSINGDDGGLWVPSALSQSTAAWGFVQASVAVQTTAFVDADGGKNAIYVVDNTINSQHSFIRYLPSFTQGATYSFSTFAKKNGVRYLWLAQDGPGYQYFDLQAGTVGASGSGASGTITSAGNGWYYCTATFMNYTSNRLFVGMSPNNGSAGYAGTGAQGVLIYKNVVEIDSGTALARPMVIGGAGLQPTLAPNKNPTFGEVGGFRVVVRKITTLPAVLKAGGAIPSSGAYAQGMGVGEAFTKQLFLQDVPNGATLLSVAPYFIVVFGHSAIPILPSLSVKRTTVTSGVEEEMRFAGPMQFPNPGGPNNGVEFYQSPPPDPSVFPTTGGTAAIQQWTYTTDQNNVIDRSAYFYTMVMTDEQGGNALQGNIFLGFALTYAAPDIRVA